jgi:hypothetical protein
MKKILKTMKVYNHYLLESPVVTAAEYKDVLELLSSSILPYLQQISQNYFKTHAATKPIPN